MRNRAFAVIFVLSLILAPCSSVQSEPPQDIHIQAHKEEITVLENRRYFETLLGKIDSARKDILISMYVFKTSGKTTNSANRIKEALIKAAKRRVEVKVLLERENGRGSSINAENEYTAGRLIKGGVKVYFDLPRVRTHVKAIVIDRRYTFIGSHNLTASALQYNRELSLMIESEEVSREAARYIEEMIVKSKK